MPLNVHLKMVKIVSFMLCVFYQNEQIAPEILEGFQKPEPGGQGLARARLLLPVEPRPAPPPGPPGSQG